MKHKKVRITIRTLLLPDVNQFIYCSIESKIAKSSSTVAARSMAIRVSLKLGIPLNKGAAAKCLRMCKMPRLSSYHSTLRNTCSFIISICS